MKDAIDPGRRLAVAARDPLIGLTGAIRLDHYRHVAKAACIDQYERLGREAREGRAELAADRLIPGDAIYYEGCVLQVADMHVTDRMVLLDVRDLDYRLSLHRDRMVRLVHAVGCEAPKATASILALDASIATDQAIWWARIDAQRSALKWVVKLGSGCKVNASTARALERRGLVETHENSFTGQTSAQATEVGRKVAEQYATGS